MAFYGRHRTSHDADYGYVSYNQQRASVYNKTTENGWAHKIGIWAGRTPGQAVPTAKLAVWSTSSLSPATRLAVHDGVALTTYMGDQTGGQAYEVSITPFKMSANTNYAIGVVSTGDMMTFGMVQAARISGENENIYNRDGITYPANPNGYTYSSYEGWISAWIEYQANRTPTAATSAPSGLVTTTSPTFSGTFSDADYTYGDRVKQMRIQVIRVSNNAVMWDTGTVGTTGTEQTNKTFSRAYGGSALSAGVEYKWRIQVADDFGAWSAWTAYRTFTINGGGSVTSSNTPTGKQNSIQPTPFTATWTHASSLSMNAVEVRIKQGSSVIRTSGTITKSVSNGNTISATWAEAFGSYTLTWGNEYSWEMRGRDTGSLWSGWSTARSFSTNNAPDIPYNLTPTNSTPSTSRPLLKATATDADGDTVTVKARIKNSSGTVLYTRTMTNLGSGNFSYQTTSTDLASHATYKWDAYSYDGYLYSGATTSEASATKSSEAAFIYGAGPVVTITSPSTTVTTSSPNVTWTATDQVKYRVVLSQDGGTVYDSGTVTSASQSHNIPSGVLREGQTYDLAVTVTNSAPLSGTSNVLTFLVDFPTPDAVTGLHASAEYQEFDLSPSSVRVTWDESTDPNFLEYLIVRNDGSHEEIIGRINSASQTVFVDYMPQSGVDYTYGVSVATVVGLDILVSEEVTANTSVTLTHVVLSDVQDGGSNRVGLHFDEDRGIDHNDDLVLEHPWGQRAPTGVYGTAQYVTFGGTFKLITSDLGSARQHIEAVRGLWQSRATICYRDERGRKFFCKIRKFSEEDSRIQNYKIDLELVEIGFHEGVE